MDVNTSNPPAVVLVEQPSEVLRIMQDGTFMRGSVPVSDLSKDELIKLVHDLVDLIRKK